MAHRFDTDRGRRGAGGAQDSTTPPDARAGADRPQPQAERAPDRASARTRAVAAHAAARRASSRQQSRPERASAPRRAGRRDNQSRAQANARRDNGRYDGGRYDSGRYDNGRYYDDSRYYTPRSSGRRSCASFPIARTSIVRATASASTTDRAATIPYGYTPRGYYDPIPGRPYGGVRITGVPRDARVFADGYYVGIVNDFDGIFQHLNLEAGPHHVEIDLGYDAIEFNVFVRPGETTTFRGDRLSSALSTRSAPAHGGDAEYAIGIFVVALGAVESSRDFDRRTGREPEAPRQSRLGVVATSA